MNKKPIQYKDLTQYSETIGAVALCGMDIQLCDYVEARDGQWYAIAYFTAGRVTKNAEKQGVIVRDLPSVGANDPEMRLVYVPESLLDQAVPRYDDDGQTPLLISRLQKELSRLNSSSIGTVPLSA